jgi:hypothetical protein
VVHLRVCVKIIEMLCMELWLLQRLWIKTNLKLGNWHFHRGEYTKLARIVKSVRQKMEEREDDMFLLEVGSSPLLSASVFCVVVFFLCRFSPSCLYTIPTVFVVCGCG